MKNKVLIYSFLYSFVLSAMVCSAQVKIGPTAGETPHASAMLEIESDDRSLLIPRISLTTNKMLLVSGAVTPTDGMVIYNTNTNSSTNTSNSTGTSGRVGLEGPGFYIYSTDNNRWNKILETSDIDPPGTYRYSRASAAVMLAAGYLPCDGRTISSATYPALSALLGTAFGSSGGNNRLPDFRGRVFAAISAGGVNGAAIPSAVDVRDADSDGSSSDVIDITDVALGPAGAETAVLSVAQMPLHQHRTSIKTDFDLEYGRTPLNETYSMAVAPGSHVTQTGAYTNDAGTTSPSGHSVIQPTLFGGTLYIKY